MAFYIIKPLAQEIEVTTDNNVLSAPVIRVFASATTLVTIKDSLGSVKSSITLFGGDTAILEKLPTDTVSSVSPIHCVPIAYR